MSELPRHVADSNNAPDLVDWLGTKNFVPTLISALPLLSQHAVPENPSSLCFHRTPGVDTWRKCVSSIETGLEPGARKTIGNRESWRRDRNWKM